MLRLFLIILISSLYSNIIISQELSTRLVVPDNEWHISVNEFSSNEVVYYKIRVQDTMPEVVDDLSFFYLQTNTTLEDDNWSHGVLGLAEKDGKVYRKNNSDIGYDLLYDFNVSTGDSIKNYFLHEDRTLVITKIDTVKFLDEIERKRIHLKTADIQFYEEDRMVWIEGVGNTRFPLWWVMFPNVIESEETLECFKKNEQVVYSPNNNCLTTSILEINNETPVLFPNPAFENVTIQSNRNIAKISIIDLSGKVINQIVNSNKLISLSGLQKGVYYIKVEYIDLKQNIYKLVKL